MPGFDPVIPPSHPGTDCLAAHLWQSGNASRSFPPTPVYLGTIGIDSIFDSNNLEIKGRQDMLSGIAEHPLTHQHGSSGHTCSRSLQEQQRTKDLSVDWIERAG